MTRDEAITAERARFLAAATAHNLPLAHIRAATLRRLRGFAPYDAARLDDDTAGDRMFGDLHTIRAELPAAA